MKTIKELYPEDWKSGDYQPMLEEFGKIIVQVDDNDYQGDSRLLYLKDGKYGYLNFGWGSCSGCDALQACGSIAEMQELMDELNESIKWFESKTEALKFFKEHDWEGDYSWPEEETKKFVEQTIKHLESN